VTIGKNRFLFAMLEVSLRARSLFTLGLGLTLTLAGCTETATSTTSSVATEQARLLVKVLDTNDLPIVGARVNLGDLPMQITDAAGAVLFDELELGRFFVHIERTGYVPANVEVDLRNEKSTTIEPRLIPIASGETCADDSSGECSVMAPDQTTCTGGPGCGGIAVWSKAFHAEYNTAVSVAADGADNVILAGDENETQTYVGKYDSDGNEVWRKLIKSEGRAPNVRRMLVDSAGNVVVVAYYYGAVEVDGNSVSTAGDSNILVTKFDADGNHLWSRRPGATVQNGVDSAAVDAAGNIILSGTVLDWVDLGSGPAYGRPFVMKLDANGELLWTTPLDLQLTEYYLIGSVVYNFPVKIDIRGNVIVAGAFQGTANLGASLVQSLSAQDVFLVKLDPNGKHIWNKQFGMPNTADKRVADLVTDNVGNIVLMGTVADEIDFGGGILPVVGPSDVFLASFTEAGQHRWSKRFEGQFLLNPLSMSMDVSGDVVLAGAFSETAHFGGESFACAGGMDVYVAKFDQYGSHLWSRQFGAQFTEETSATAMDGLGNVLIAGGHRGPIDFGTGALDVGDHYSVFLAKLTP